MNSHSLTASSKYAIQLVVCIVALVSILLHPSAPSNNVAERTIEVLVEDPSIVSTITSNDSLSPIGRPLNFLQKASI